MTTTTNRYGRVGWKNAYYCAECRGYIVTVDVDDGVTPMFLACRVAGEPNDPANTCRGQMTSMMYPDPPWPDVDGYGDTIPTEPTWEWYSPMVHELARLELALIDHVEKGGLLLRRRA